MQNIYLIGYMGTGKSTIAQELSKLLPMQIVEMDASIETLAGKSISEIFKNDSEETFRIMETQFLKAISLEKNQIISCGGGVVLKQENIEILKKTGIVILLKASSKTIYNRVCNNHDRPLLENKKTEEDILHMMQSREPYYDAAKDFEVIVDNKSPKEISDEIIRTLAMNDLLH